MPANTNPVYSLSGKLAPITLVAAANTRSDGAGTIGSDMTLVCQGGSNGSLLSRARFIPVASVAATTTSATTLRLYVSTQSSGATTNANTFLIGEITAGAQVADHSTNAIFPYEQPLDFVLPSGWSLLASQHIVPASNTNWQCVVFGGDY